MNGDLKRIIGQIKPIDTPYNGYWFRSRLEARWAVFFDTLGIPYRYEPDGFNLNGIRYLPDFLIRIAGIDYWVEVKPRWPTSRECEKLIRLSRGTDQDALILVGDVWVDTYKAVNFLPFVLVDAEEIIPEFAFHRLSPTKFIWLVEDNEHFVVHDRKRDFTCCGVYFRQCTQCQKIFLASYPSHCICGNCGKGDYGNALQTSPLLRKSFIAARSARFEYGSKGNLF